MYKYFKKNSASRFGFRPTGVFIKKTGLNFSIAFLVTATIGLVILDVKPPYKQKTISYPENPFNAPHRPAWDFAMKGITLTSHQKNGAEFELKAQEIRYTPLKSHGITFLSYSRLVVKNAQIKITPPDRGMPTKTAGHSPFSSSANSDKTRIRARSTSASTGLKSAITDDVFTASRNGAHTPNNNQQAPGSHISLFNTLSEMAGGSPQYVLDINRIEAKPANSRVIIQIELYPIELTTSLPDNTPLEIKAAHGLAEMVSGVTFSGGVLIKTSPTQKLHCERVICFDSFREFIIKGVYSFHSDGRIIKGENGFFKINNRKLCLTDDKPSRRKAKNSIDPLVFCNAMMTKAVFPQKSNNEFNLFYQLFLGPFDREPPLRLIAPAPSDHSDTRKN